MTMKMAMYRKIMQYYRDAMEWLSEPWREGSRESAKVILDCLYAVSEFLPHGAWENFVMWKICEISIAMDEFCPWKWDYKRAGYYTGT